MKLRAWALALAVVVSVPVAAFAQQPVNTWSVQMYQVHADTLPRFAADSVVTTSEFSIKDARLIVVECYSSATDTVTLPAPQIRLSGSESTYLGTAVGATFGTPAAPTGGVNLTTAGKVTYYLSGADAGGGTPYPISASGMRLRLRSANARRYSGASGTNLSAQGTITVKVWVYR